jgi:hypothetical protein
MGEEGNLHLRGTHHSIRPNYESANAETSIEMTHELSLNASPKSGF